MLHNINTSVSVISVIVYDIIMKNYFITLLYILSDLFDHNLFLDKMPSIRSEIITNYE